MNFFEKHLIRENKGDPRGKPTPKPIKPPPGGPPLRSRSAIEIDGIQKLEFRKGDILVLKYQHVLSTEAKINIERSCEQVLNKVGLKDDVGIIVLEQGLSIEAVLTQKRDDYGQKKTKKVGLPHFLPDIDIDRRMAECQ